MKKVMNDPTVFVDESLAGIVAAHGDMLKFADDPRALVRADAPKTGKVAIVTGGGYGHLPTFLGFVGEGFCDGVPFAGGKDTGYDLAIGSHSFIDTFEEQLIGKNIGDEVEVNVTFPAEYHAAELAGKPAMFKVKVNGIKVKELPELDDDFAQDVSEFDTLEEYKNDLKATLLERKEKDAKAVKEEAVVDAIIEGAKMDIPEPMIQNTVAQMAEDFAQRIQAQGLSIEQYFQFTGMNANTFMENLKPQALKRIQSRLVLEAVVKAEGITASEEDVNKEIENMAAMYQMEVDKLMGLIGEEEKKAMAEDVAVQKALELVVNAAVEK